MLSLFFRKKLQNITRFFNYSIDYSFPDFITKIGVIIIL